jgi:hypothetical protein
MKNQITSLLFCVAVVLSGLFACQKEQFVPISAVSVSSADTLGKVKVWNLYRTTGVSNPACSSTPATQTISYTSNLKPGSVIKASNGLCYSVANVGFQLSAPSFELDQTYMFCTECTESK